MSKKSVNIFRQWQKSPVRFVRDNWGLVPQPVKGEYKDYVLGLTLTGRLTEIRVEHFEPFIKGKHITWQQWVILMAVENAIKGISSKRISVRSGHGIGKSCTLAWLIIWFLVCHKDAQIPCTAPTSDQMHDVLWKELAKWIMDMKPEIGDNLEISNQYLRVKERPETWFARAKTARRENPEALAGVHGDHVMFVVDESSGVPVEIFNTAEGALTNANIFFIMISNPVRLDGYFFDSHHEDSASWQTLAFNANESPIVDNQFVQRILVKHGKDSDEYRYRVLGEFPAQGNVDDKGYVPLLRESDLAQVSTHAFRGRIYMGVDPAGLGRDETVWAIRDTWGAKIIAKEKISTPKSIAAKTLQLLKEHGVDSNDIFIDNFGEGANVAAEIALLSLKEDRILRVSPVNVGDPADDAERFLNKRAEAYWRLRTWLRQGAVLVKDEGWKELLTIRYKDNERYRLKIMSKREMQINGIESPNCADALMLTFYEDTLNATAHDFAPGRVITTALIDPMGQYGAI